MESFDTRWRKAEATYKDQARELKALSLSLASTNATISALREPTDKGLASARNDLKILRERTKIVENSAEEATMRSLSNTRQLNKLEANIKDLSGTQKKSVKTLEKVKETYSKVEKVLNDREATVGDSATSPLLNSPDKQRHSPLSPSAEHSDGSPDPNLRYLMAWTSKAHSHDSQPRSPPEAENLQQTRDSEEDARLRHGIRNIPVITGSRTEPVDASQGRSTQPLYSDTTGYGYHRLPQQAQEWAPSDLQDSEGHLKAEVSIRRRTLDFYVGNIQNGVSVNDIESFFASNGLNVVGTKVLPSRNEFAGSGAKVTIWSSDNNLFRSIRMPQGIYVRQWFERQSRPKSYGPRTFYRSVRSMVSGS